MKKLMFLLMFLLIIFSTYCKYTYREYELIGKEGVVIDIVCHCCRHGNFTKNGFYYKQTGEFCDPDKGYK